MKVALFGGSFNPIHQGHIKIIHYLLSKKIVNQVWIIPCKKHAFDKFLLDEKQRLGLIKDSIKKIKNTKICYVEIKSRRKNYTINTVKKLKSKYKRHDFYLIIGSDILYEIKKWHRYQELFKKVSFIIFKRKGFRIINVPGMKIYRVISHKPNDLSSTNIRKKFLKENILKGYKV